MVCESCSIKLFNENHWAKTSSDPEVILLWVRSECAESRVEKGPGRVCLVCPVQDHCLVREGGQWSPVRSVGFAGKRVGR